MNSIKSGNPGLRLKTFNAVQNRYDICHFKIVSNMNHVHISRLVYISNITFGPVTECNQKCSQIFNGVDLKVRVKLTTLSKSSLSFSSMCKFNNVLTD